MEAGNGLGSGSVSEATEPCMSPETSQFDFWLGQWDLSWPAEQTGGTAGERASGSNTIDRLFGNCVVEENFAFGDDSFKGRSLSVFDQRTGRWRQTWVDSQGGYLVLNGEWDGETMQLRTDPIERHGEELLNRMVFRDITAESLRWEWQGSRDGGKTWNDLWIIDYVRRP